MQELMTAAAQGLDVLCATKDETALQLPKDHDSSQQLRRLDDYIGPGTAD
jgi:hypothetical protein